MCRQRTLSVLSILVAFLTPQGAAAQERISCIALNDLVGHRWEVFTGFGPSLFISNQRPQKCEKLTDFNQPAFRCVWQSLDDSTARDMFEDLVLDVGVCFKVDLEGFLYREQMDWAQFRGVQSRQRQLDSEKDKAWPVVNIDIVKESTVDGSDIHFTVAYFPATQDHTRPTFSLARPSARARQDRAEIAEEAISAPSTESPSPDRDSTAHTQSRAAYRCDWAAHKIAQRNGCHKQRGTVSACHGKTDYVECYRCDMPPSGPSQGDLTWFLKKDGTCDGVTLE